MDAKTCRLVARALLRAAEVLGQGKTVALWHLTDQAKFRLNKNKVPTDNTVSIYERTKPGLFLADRLEPWINGKGYVRPFAVEVEAPEDVLIEERWGGEKFLPAEHFDKAKVLRVIPLDAYARETFSTYGWTEEFFRTTFDTNEPIDAGDLYKYQFRGWQYRDDVRTADSAWVSAYKKRVRDYARKR